MFIKRSSPKITDIKVGSNLIKCSVCGKPFIADSSLASICNDCVGKTEEEKKNVDLRSM